MSSKLSDRPNKQNLSFCFIEKIPLQDFNKKTLASVVRRLLSLRRVVAAKIIEVVGFQGITIYVIGLKISKKC